MILNDKFINPEPPIIIFSIDGQEFVIKPLFFSNNIKVDCFCKILLHFYIFLLFFLLTMSLLISYACVSMESIDCILLSSFEFNAILLVSSMKILFLLLLNLCCVFSLNLFFYEFFMIFFMFI